MTEEDILYTYVSVTTIICIVALVLIVKNAIRLYRIKENHKRNHEEARERILRCVCDTVVVDGVVCGVGTEFLYILGECEYDCVVTKIEDGEIHMTIDEHGNHWFDYDQFKRYFQGGMFRRSPKSDGPTKYVMKHKFI